MENNKKQIGIQILLIILFSLFCGSLFFITPFFGDLNMIDEGQFAAWANHMLFGKLMYRDIYITYGPLYVYPLYLWYKFFGPSAFAIRILYTCLNTVLGMIFILLLLPRLFVKRLWIWITAWSVLLLSGPALRSAFPFLIISLLFRKNMRPLQYFLSGACACIAFLISPENGFFSIVIITLVLAWESVTVKEIQVLFSHIVFSISGFLVPVLFFLLWSGKEGWLSSYIWTTQDVLQHFSSIALPNGQALPHVLFSHTIFSFSGFLYYFFSKDVLLYGVLIFYMVAVFYGISRFVLQKANQSDSIIFLLTLYGFYTYYTLIGRAGNFFLALSPLLIITVYFYSILFQQYRKIKIDRTEKIAIFFLSMCLLYIPLRVFLIYRPHFVLVSSSIVAPFIKIQNPKRVGQIMLTSMQKQQIEEVEAYFKKQKIISKNIFIFSNTPMFYMLLNKVNPTRYDLPYIADTFEKRLELLNDLQRTKPQYILIDTNDWPVDGVSNRERLPEVYNFIKSSYKLEATIHAISIYTLK